MQSQHTNRSTHNIQDNRIMAAMDGTGSQQLNYADTQRAKQQIQQIKTGNYTDAHKDEYKNQMQGVRGSDGKILLHGNTKMY